MSARMSVNSNGWIYKYLLGFNHSPPSSFSCLQEMPTVITVETFLTAVSCYILHCYSLYLCTLLVIVPRSLFVPSLPSICILALTILYSSHLPTKKANSHKCVCFSCQWLIFAVVSPFTVVPLSAIVSLPTVVLQLTNCTSPTLHLLDMYQICFVTLQAFKSF